MFACVWWDDRTHKVLAQSEKDKSTTAQAAMKVADELMGAAHPIWPNRGRHIVASLVADKWHQKKAGSV